MDFPPRSPTNTPKLRKSHDLLVPRGLSRVQAARYLGISPSLYDIMVGDGRMPKPKSINSRKVWDRLQIDEAFEALDGNEALLNLWDKK